MKVKAIATVLALVGCVGVANAETMDAHEADRTATIKRQVVYKCQGGKSLAVTYGFNKQKLPTFAEAKMDGKTRFMPINLTHSDIAGTMFGDEDNYNIGATAITLGNYHKSELATVQNAASEILFKDCRAKSFRKVR